VRSPNCDYDHYLVKVKIKDRLATIDNNKRYERQEWKVDKSKELEQSQLYQKTIKTKLEALRTEPTENENEQVEQQSSSSSSSSIPIVLCVGAKGFHEASPSTSVCCQSLHLPSTSFLLSVPLPQLTSSRSSLVFLVP
jgi:hypothetical protein